jgi:hypothetical protein
MTSPRLTLARLRHLADELSDRHTTVLLHLSRARVLTGRQLDRLLEPDPGSAARTAERARQRAMARLTVLGLVDTLDRRVGGVRAGSAGHVHVLTTAGHTLAALLEGDRLPRRVRHSRRPGPMFLAHAIDIAEIYVQLVEHSRSGSGFTVAAFVTEPDSWWHQHGLRLRPDAYTLLRASNHGDCWWIEVDRATESIPRLRDKLRVYLDHFTSGGLGPDGAPPRVLITAPDSRRCGVVTDLITGLPPPAGELFCALEHHRAARFLITAVHDMGET